VTGKVLIIDDDPIHLTVAEEILQADGHEVVVNRTGFGATVKVLKERPDVVLLDVNMPGLSGDAVASLLQRCQKEHPMSILLYSSNDEDSLRKTSASLGTDGFVMKGDPGALRHAVRRAIWRHRL
jgi:CheY-like chemotaxis protein